MRMGSMRLESTLHGLYDEIHQSFLGWLASRDLDEERIRLEKLMLKYLYHAPHPQKFHAQVAHIIRLSAVKKDDFNGKRAARAFAAVAKYAFNLISQPWRQEFYEIKLYCGYYKHQISEVLLNAELLFEMMGYRRVGNSLKLLGGVVDPDAVTQVCTDVLMAQLECTIMHQIWEKSQDITWGEICAYREEFIGDVASAVRHLYSREKERRYMERHDQRSRTDYIEQYHMQPPGYTVGYAHNVMIPCHQQGCGMALSPSQPLPPYQPQYSQYSMPQHALKPHDVYPTNMYPQPYHTHQNGFPFMQPAMTPHYSIPTTVPTAKLIEVDSPPVHHPHVSTSHSYPLIVPDAMCTTEFPSSKAKNDGVASWETWDCLYRDSSYCKKDVPSSPIKAEKQLSSTLRGITLAQPSVPRIENEQRKTMKSVELDIVPKQRVARAEIIESDRERYEEVLQVNKSKSIKQQDDGDNGRFLSKVVNHEDVDVTDFANPKSSNLMKGDWEDAPKLNVNMMMSRDKSPVTKNKRDSPAKVNVVKEQSPVPRPNVITFDVSPSFAREVSPVVDLPPEKKWECASCTYLNEERKNACEMCGKSRIRDEIKPHPSGGRECPQCTLVNESTKNFCAACNAHLKGSPTYV